MSELPLWVDGRFVDPEEAAISPRDPGFLLGLACFETILFEEGCLYFLEEHLSRLERSARGLSIDWPPRRELERALLLFGERLPVGESSAVRITVTPGAPGAGPSAVIDARPVPLSDPAGVEVLLVERASLAASPLAALKSSSRAAHHLARARAEGVGAREALLGTDEGDIVEGSASNLFVIRGGEGLTPSLDRGCLPGIVRAKVVGELSGAEFPIVEGAVFPRELLAAEEVFLTSSLARILPVRGIRGLREDLPGARGPLTRRLAERFRGLEERYRASRPK